MIPYGRQYVDEADINAVCETLKSDFLTTGPKVAEFEKALCDSCGVLYASAVSNGTAALHLAALCLINKNDKVLVSPNTFAASVNAIIYASGVPVFCDIDSSGNMDLDLARKICEREKIDAIVAVHFSGKTLDVQKLTDLKNDFGLKIIEDGAHALGAKDICKVGDVATLSFHPVKHITTGEGGAVITNNANIDAKIKLLRTHGIARDGFVNSKFAFDKNGLTNPWYYEMQELGFNYRIADFACALGISQLKKLDLFVKERKTIAKKYCEAFKNRAEVKPLYGYDESSSYHLFVVLIDFEKIGKTKAELFYFAKSRGVGLQTHYIPVNAQPFYTNMGYNYNDTPNALSYYEQCVSLPIFYGLDEQEKVIDVMLEFIKAPRG